MPESTFLHIQSRGRSPARVMELPGDAVRIGRGIQCEIRLGEPSLAEVECLLRRRGTSWDIQPLGPSGHVTIDGRPVEHLRALVPGVPLRVGDYWLTIRPSGAVSPGFGTYEAPISGEIPIHPSAIASPVETDRLSDRPYADPTNFAANRPIAGPSEPGPALGAKIRDNHEFRERWHKTRREQRSWEARWRAAGESLRSRDVRPATSPPRPPQPAYPSNSVATRPPWKQDEVKSERVAEAEIVASPRLLVTEPVDESLVDEEFKNEFWEPEPVVEIASESVADAPIPTVEVAKVPEREAISPPPAMDLPVEPVVSSSPLIPSTTPTRRPRASRRSSTSGSRAPKADPPLPAMEDLDWPSARVILAMAAPPSPAASAKKSPKKAETRPLPTEAEAPRAWKLPAWMGLLSAAFLLMIAVVGVMLAWSWGQDDREAGLLADRLLRRDAKAETFRLWWKA